MMAFGIPTKEIVAVAAKTEDTLRRVDVVLMNLERITADLAVISARLREVFDARKVE